MGRCTRCILASMKLVLLVVLISTVMVLTSHFSSWVNTEISVVRTRVMYTCPAARLSDVHLPVTALASFPGSGNTWFRHLLQEMTGILTGAIYYDTALKRAGFPAEGRQDGRVVAIKTHIRYDQNKNAYKRVILLVRNPFEAFISEYTRQVSHSHVGRVDIHDYKDWSKVLNTMIANYRLFHMSWMRHKYVHIVMYDKLKTNLKHELVRINEFLNIQNITGTIECALLNSEGSHHRNTSRVPLAFMYTQAERTKINNMIGELCGVFDKRFNRTHVHMLKWKLS